MNSLAYSRVGLYSAVITGLCLCEAVEGNTYMSHYRKREAGCQGEGTSQQETQVWCSDSEANVSPLSLKDNSGLVTEKRIFTMAGQVASALVGETAGDLSVYVSVVKSVSLLHGPICSICWERDFILSPVCPYPH